MPLYDVVVHEKWRYRVEAANAAKARKKVSDDPSGGTKSQVLARTRFGRIKKVA